MADNTPSSLRKKRNFKNLSLPPSSANASSSSLAGAAAGGSKDALDAAGSVASITERISQLAINNDLVKFDTSTSDFDELGELGHGNGGTVKKVLHKPTGKVMAKKALLLDVTPFQTEGEATDNVKKQVIRELQILHQCHSPWIVSFYGAFIENGEISICMEYMNLGSLDAIYRKIGRMSEDVLGKITVAVLEGLLTLTRRADVKPNNILLDVEGNIKLCDFGVSGEAVNSVVNTFVGTSAYMSPERIRGLKYSVQSDVWSLGIALMELAIGRFPFPPEDDGENRNLAVFELLEYIVNEKVPGLPTGDGWSFTDGFRTFLDICLTKDPMTRPTPSQLTRHEFVKIHKDSTYDMAAWAKSVSEQVQSKG
ncbi:MAP kinase kinase (MEK) [Sorochytrium milnesiophthora]